MYRPVQTGNTASIFREAVQDVTPMSVAEATTTVEVSAKGGTDDDSSTKAGNTIFRFAKVSMPGIENRFMNMFLFASKKLTFVSF